MKRAVIVHCWDGYPQYCWYPDTAAELTKHGFQVSVPAMPETSSPKLSHWLPKLQEVVREPDRDLYLIGHSSGCITILRYLETLPSSQQVGGVVLVAGFTDDLGYSELSNFFTTPLDFTKIKFASKQGFVAIHSDNDPYVPLKHAMKHFSGPVDGEDSCTSLPDVASSILQLSS